MLKPSWMSARDWVEYRKRYPVFRCSRCPETDPREESIDHIIPRELGGKHALDNFQPMCKRCNSSKGTRSDAFLAQNHYFDDGLTLDVLRVAHRQELWDRILNLSDWFSRPFSDIALVLYTLAWIVGAGKTLAIPVLAFALNHVILRERGRSSRRVCRILVLCKEQAIRDQIARDLEEDIVRLGLCKVPPRVGRILTGSTLADPGVIAQKDIWVSCIHMFFEKNGVPREDLCAILARFDLIVFDEPHYAVDQVLGIVSSAPTSLCFGLTGTPIDATGSQLERFINFSIYDYQQACENDQSLKYLVSPDHPSWNLIYEEVDIIEAEMQGGGKNYTTPTTKVAGYPENIRPVISVVESVVRYIHDCDSEYIPDFPLIAHSPALHRDPDAVIPDNSYPVHGLIKVETIEIGEMVVSKLNAMFDTDRRRYPLARGWRAELVRSDLNGLDENGKAQIDKGQKLGADHPWMKAYRNGGKLQPDSARVLVVVGMGREGINNPLCGVVGVACKDNSLIDHIQRTFGRMLRAFTRRLEGRLHVPPDRLDTAKVITHSAFGNRPYIEAAARYLLDMSGALDGLPTMSDLIDGEHEIRHPDAINPDALMSGREKIDVAGEVGRRRLAGLEPIDIEDIVRNRFPTVPEPKKDKIREWTKTVIDRPGAAVEALGLNSILPEIPRVMLEHLELGNPSDDVLTRFIRRVFPSFVKYLNQLDNPIIRELLAGYYAEHARRFHNPDLPVQDKASKIKGRLGTEVIAYLGNHYDRSNSKYTSQIYKLCYTAMKMVLGVKDDEILCDGGNYDTPECHVILTRPEVWRSMRGWVIRALISGGFCPTLAAGLALGASAGGLDNAA